MYNTGVTSYQRGECNIFENSASFALTSFIFLSGSHDLTHVAVIVGVSYPRGCNSGRDRRRSQTLLRHVILFVIVSFDHCAVGFSESEGSMQDKERALDGDAAVRQNLQERLLDAVKQARQQPTCTS